MLDTFGRTIDYLRLSVTDRCNLRCRYCMPEEGVPPMAHEQILSYEELLRVTAVALRLGVKKVRVTGGEPLVRRGIVDFIRQLAALPGAPEVALTTNGLRLAEMADDLKAAGLSRVNISLDTLRPERFAAITRREGLSRVLAALEAAESAGLTPLKLNMVPIRGVNADEIADFARLTLERSWQVRFIEFMPVSGGLDYPPESRFPAADIQAALATVAPLVALPRSGPAGPARIYRFAGGRGSVGIIPAVSNHFCGECNRLRLTADGRLRPCLFSTEEIDLKAALRQLGEGALEQLLLGAVTAKPERHAIGEAGFRQGSRRMQEIGG
ncbi:MAG: GTP 3',8-cyclase MoaA [Desulfuromonadales bacterium]